MIAPKKSIAYSYSRINKFQGCPAAYKFAYIDKVKTPKGEPLIFGDLVHRFMERYINVCMEHKLPSDVDVAASIADALLSDPKVMSEAPLPVQRHDEFRQLCEAAARQVIVSDKVFGAECQYAFNREYQQVEWFGDPSCWFRLKVDRLDKTSPDSVHVTDYKTSWKADADELQFDVYAWAIMHLFPPCQTVTSSLHFLRLGIEKPTKNPYTRDDLPDLDKKIGGLMRRIEEEQDFKPTPGAACDWCEFAHLCKAKPSGLTRATTEAEAAQLASDLVVLETQAKQLKKALQSWNVEHGFVDAGGLRWGYHTSETLRFDPRQFIAACAETGRDPDGFLSVDTRKAGKLLRDKDDAVKAAFAAIATTEKKQLWKGKKIGDEEE